jgi:hypothetical protein
MCLEEDVLCFTMSSSTIVCSYSSLVPLSAHPWPRVVCRCFFIHLGIATQFHPFALQTYFRFTAASERDEEGAQC